jgi:hypothetical protein
MLQKLILVQGDVAPVPMALLTDTAGDPLNLEGASVRFRLVDYRSGLVVVDRPATILQNTPNMGTWGQVTYYWQQSDTRVPGLYRAAFATDYGNGEQHFPPDGSYFVLIKEGNVAGILPTPTPTPTPTPPPSSGGDLSYVHTQAVPAALWTITHNLGKHPSVSTVDSAGTWWLGDVTYIDANTLVLHFGAHFAGAAYLN